MLDVLWFAGEAEYGIGQAFHQADTDRVIHKR